MSDKERLEEINQNIAYIKKNSLTPNEIITWSGWKSILPIFTEDLEYLQEQDERVQELEKEFDELESEYIDLNNDFTKLAMENKRLKERAEKLESESYNAHLERLLDKREEQNKHYREALMTIAVGDDHFAKYEDIARDALEAEK